MANLTRRKLIKRASISVGATGVLAAAAAAGTHLGASTPASAHVTQQSLGNSSEPLVVCVTNAASGTLVVMRGEREITINNPDLVQRLLSL